jgi:hypothetical protein
MSGVELRQESDGRWTLTGHASVTGVYYPIGNGVQEQIAKGAFRGALAESPDVSLLVSHGEGGSLPLARTKSANGGNATLRLSEDSVGLACVATLNPADPDVQSLAAKAEHFPLEMSFAFRCNRDSYNAAMDRRTVHEVNLHRGDISVVGSGANQATSFSISQREAATTLEMRRELADRRAGHVYGTGSPASFDGIAHEAAAPYETQALAVGIARAYVDVARARRGPAAEGRARLDVHDRPSGEAKYSRAELEALVKDGRAFRRTGGEIVPVVGREDLQHAVRLYLTLPAVDLAPFKEFLRVRAAELKMNSLIPASWRR